MRRLTLEEVDAIRAAPETISDAALGRRFKVHRMTIVRVRNGSHQVTRARRQLHRQLAERYFSSDLTLAEVGKEFGVSLAIVWNACNRRKRVQANALRATSRRPASP